MRISQLLALLPAVSAQLKQVEQAVDTVGEVEEFVDHAVEIVEPDSAVDFSGAPVFEASNEWQQVPDGFAVPKGIELRMDLETGEVFARLASSDPDASKEPHELAMAGPPELALPHLELDDEMLTILEDAAHDIDHGEELMHSHYLFLAQALIGDDAERKSKAAKILTASLRNNPNAARSLNSQDSYFPNRLALPGQPKFVPGSPVDIELMTVFGALVSTKQGREAFAPAIRQLQHGLGEARWTKATAHRLKRIIEDNALETPQSTAPWAAAIMEGLVHSVPNTESKQSLCHILEEIWAGKDNFENCSKPALNKAFQQWLADEASADVTKAGEHEKQWVLHARKVVHSVFGNAKALRVHFDEL